MGRIYELRHLVSFRRSDIHTKLHTSWYSHLKVNGAHPINLRMQTRRQQGKLKSVLLFFQNKENMLRI
jgi:hypothetical protein